MKESDKKDVNTGVTNITTLASKVFDNMLTYSKIILDLKSASYLHQLILSLHVISAQEFHKLQCKQIRKLH